MPEHLLTLNHLFVQFIEQIDKNGVTSNLADLMFHLLSEQQAAGGDGVKGSHHLILNEPISVLMVPPEHQGMMGPVVEKIKAILR